VGCTARITQILRQFENGSMDILTEGRKRFRVLDVLNRESYLEAVVEYFDDDSEDIPSDLLKKVLDAYQKMIRLQTRGVGAIRGIFDPVHFSFIIASTLDMVLQERQSLLELTSTTERIRKLDTALLDTMQKLGEQEKMKRLADMNGHGKHEPEESESAGDGQDR
jgi:ATP-dependent Lon protease